MPLFSASCFVILFLDLVLENDFISFDFSSKGGLAHVVGKVFAAFQPRARMSNSRLYQDLNLCVTFSSLFELSILQKSVSASTGS